MSALTSNFFYHLSTVLNKQPTLEEVEKITGIGYFSRVFYRIVNRRESRILNVINKAMKAFLETEKETIKFYDSKVEEVKPRAEAYKKRFFDISDNFKKFDVWIASLNISSPRVKEAVHRLKCHHIGMMYRIEKANGGKNTKEPKPEDLEQLIKFAEEWKKKEPKAKDKNLNEREKKQLIEAVRYRKWLPLLFENKKYQQQFFNWALRDYNRVDVFILTPNTQNRLHKALLSCYIGRTRDPHANLELLNWEKVTTSRKGEKKKRLTMTFYEGGYKEFEPEWQSKVNILNPDKKVHFHPTWREIEKECSQKYYRECDYNITPWGMTPWNPLKGRLDPLTGKYTQPDWTKEDAIENLPPFEFVNTSDLVAKYGHQASQSFVKIMASRTALDLSAKGCHAYRLFYFPKMDGTTKVVSISAYAPRFHSTWWEALLWFAKTFYRVYAQGLDQNPYYTHRQQTGVVQFLSKDEMAQSLSNLRIRIMDPQAPFHVAGGHSCAGEIQSSMEEVLKEKTPNYFKMRTVDGQTGIKFIDKYFEFLRNRHPLIQKIGVLFISFCLGSTRSIEVKDGLGVKKCSVWRHHWNSSEICNPTYLAYQVEKGISKDFKPEQLEITWGNTERFYLLGENKQ